jgi:hypothetical protein
MAEPAQVISSTSDTISPAEAHRGAKVNNLDQGPKVIHINDPDRAHVTRSSSGATK